MTGSGAWRFAAKRTAGAERVRIGHTRTARTHGHAGAREHLPARALAHTCSLAYSPARSRDPSQAHTTHERTDAWKDGRMCHAHTGRQHKCGGARASHVPCTQTHAHLHAAPQHTDARVHACTRARMQMLAHVYACVYTRAHAQVDSALRFKGTQVETSGWHSNAGSDMCHEMASRDQNRSTSGWFEKVYNASRPHDVDGLGAKCALDTSGRLTREQLSFDEGFRKGAEAMRNVIQVALLIALLPCRWERMAKISRMCV